MLTCAAVCCSVLQCVAVRCSVSQCVAVCCSVLKCVEVCCRRLVYSGRVCCSTRMSHATLMHVTHMHVTHMHVTHMHVTHMRTTQGMCVAVGGCVAVCCNVLQCVLQKEGVLYRVAVATAVQRAAGCCRVLQQETDSAQRESVCRCAHEHEFARKNETRERD